MKKILTILFIVLFMITALCPLSFAASVPVERSVLNVSAVTEEQAELCTAVMIDGFEADEAERRPDAGTIAAPSSGALEGEKCLSLTANDRAGVTLTPVKKRNTSKTRSLCVCLYVEDAPDAEFTVTVTLDGDKKTVTGTSPLPSGQWCAAYLPVDPAATLTVRDIRVSVSAVSDKTVRVRCRIDRVHTAQVDGLPDRLPYFASAFTANRAEISYTDDALVFTPTGQNSTLESSECGYMTNGLYNALAVRLINDSTADKLTVRFKLDRQINYSDNNSKTLSLLPGENVYRFGIGGFQSGTTVSSFRMELSGSVEGSIRIKSISFASYRFPAEYNGKVSARVSGETITVSGSLPDFPASSERICLYRLAPGVDEELPGDMDAQPYRTAAVSGTFRFEIPRYDGKTNNAFFKYLVRYEGKNGYEDAGVSYTSDRPLPVPSVKYKGLLYGGDAELIHSLMPGTVYTDVNVSSLFSDAGAASFEAAGVEFNLSDDVVGSLDEAVSRCASEGVCAVLKFNYGAFANSDKYLFAEGDDILPDITTAEGADFYLSLLSFFAERYKNTVRAVIPCGILNSAPLSAMRGLTPDRAEKYASSLMISAQNALSVYGVSVFAPVSYDGAADFAEMLSKDVADPSRLTLYTETEDAETANEAAKTLTACGFPVAVRCAVNGTEDLIRLYYGCGECASVCAGIGTEDEGLCELFSVIDTTRGLTLADAMSADIFPGGVSSYFKNIKAPSRSYDDLGLLPPSSLPSAVTTLYGGETTDGWSAYGCCKNIYGDELNGEPAAGAAFDFSEGLSGYASYVFDTKKTYNVLYFRLYTDYLSEDAATASVKITVYGDRGLSVGCAELNSGEITAVALPVNESAGAVQRAVLSFDDPVSGTTPRLCVLGVYTEDKNSSESVTEAEIQTMPEPESEIFDTAPQTTAAQTEPDGGGDRASLYLTAIFVIIAMFALCGAVILILKKKKGETK